MQCAHETCLSDFVCRLLSDPDSNAWVLPERDRYQTEDDDAETVHSGGKKKDSYFECSLLNDCSSDVFARLLYDLSESLAPDVGRGLPRLKFPNSALRNIMCSYR